MTYGYKAIVELLREQPEGTAFVCPDTSVWIKTSSDEWQSTETRGKLLFTVYSNENMATGIVNLKPGTVWWLY